MAHRKHPPRQRSGSAQAAEPPASTSPPVLLVRLPVDGFDWSEHLPPVPQGQDVSLSFTRRATGLRHADVLAQLGYRLVQEPGRDGAGTGEFVDMVVYGSTADDHPSWWRAVSAMSERVYPLALGPAALRWADLVSAHARGRRGENDADAAWRRRS